jgi:hypothetical protein
MDEDEPQAVGLLDFLGRHPSDLIVIATLDGINRCHPLEGSRDALLFVLPC